MSRAAAIGDRISSPIALATAVVLLVGTVGSVATALSYIGLRHAGEASAESVVNAETRRLRGDLLEQLESADALLASFRGAVVALEPGASLEPLLDDLRKLATARQGLAWVSAGLSDGRFVGVRRHEDGTLHGLISQSSPEGREWRYALEPGTPPRLLGTAPTEYDPRTRPFYRIALEAKGTPTWTPPYAFLPSMRAGISRVSAVFDTHGAMHGVITADYDTSTLAKLLSLPSTRRGRAWVVADGDVLLAVQGAAQASQDTRSGADPLGVDALGDTVVTASMAALGGARSATTMVGSEQYYVVRKRVGDLDSVGVDLYRAIPSHLLYTDANAIARRGGLVTAGVTLIGLLLAFAISRNIARLRRKRLDAEERLLVAERHAIELGSYELLERIGEGGMGEVYRARHLFLARDAALKLIHSADDDDLPRRQARFLEEARVAGSLRSIHTVSVYDFGVTDDGQCYLAMELLDGLNLEELVARHGPQPAARVARILADACDALAEAHARGFVHRDIKPANLFLCRLADEVDFIKVLDFGLAAVVRGDRFRKSTVEGTPAFMAPEQAMGETVNAAADIYALGCVAFYLLVGRAPYAIGTDTGMMEAHVHGRTPTLPPAIAATLPPAFGMLITRCLAKNPAMRPPAVGPIGDTLRRIAEECADSFPPSARAAFWADFDGPQPAVSEITASRRIAAVSRVGRAGREPLDPEARREVP